MSSDIKAAHLTLTPHHLFYLLSRVEDMGISVGPMNVRLENIHSDPSPANYVSFLQTRKVPSRGRSDKDSIHSVSSMRSVMSGMSAFWSSIGLGSSSAKSEKAKAATETELKYLYSAFTKLPSLRLTSDHRAKFIKGYEEFPFDTAVPLFAFKNVQQLDIIDLDFRQFYGWDRLAEQLCLLTVKRANIDDPTELLTNIVLDDAEKRRRRSTRSGNMNSPPTSWTVPSTPRGEYARSHSDPGSPDDGSPRETEHLNSHKEKAMPPLSGSVSPKRPTSARPTSSYRHVRSYSKAQWSGSGSSSSSDYSYPQRSESTSNLASMNILPTSKWQRLKYLSLADNGLTSISAKSLAPVATTLRSLNLSSNLFTDIPDSLSSLTRLSSLDLSNCMIESLQSLTRCPLPAITTIKLKSNRLQSLSGVERLLSLENLHVQDNLLSDPMEAARLTGIPNLRKIWLKHNPFTKKFSDYRVMTFNLFRKTPGYIEDIIIDDQGPSYSERKQLVERVPEEERQPSSTLIFIAEQVHQHPVVEDVISRPQLEHTVSTRRKKGPRRRIVDLSQENSTPFGVHFSTEAASRHAEEQVLSDSRVAERSSTTSMAAPPSKQSELDPNANGSGSASNPRGSTPHGDYRARVEALREEFGSNWISALGELQSGNNVHDLPPSPFHRPANQAILTGGCTIG